MKEIVQKILEIYFSKMREPSLEELDISAHPLLEETGCVFVTLYSKWEIIGSWWNVKEIETNIVWELIKSTISAIEDNRFPKIDYENSKTLQFRIDKISERNMISLWDIESIDPTNSGLVAIQRDYRNLGVILPNMSAKIMTGSDMIPVMQNKLSSKKIDDKNCIFYNIQTKSETNF